MVPPINWVKFNVDAYWNEGAQRGSIGLVARDSALVCIVVRCLEVSTSSAAMAEALAVIDGCLLAKNLQFQEVVIESDAQKIIRSLNSASLSYA